MDGVPDITLTYRHLSSSVMLTRNASARTMTTVPRVLFNAFAAMPKAAYGLALRLSGNSPADTREEFKILDDISGCSE